MHTSLEVLELALTQLLRSHELGGERAAAAEAAAAAGGGGGGAAAGGPPLFASDTFAHATRQAINAVALAVSEAKHLAHSLHLALGAGGEAQVRLHLSRVLRKLDRLREGETLIVPTAIAKVGRSVGRLVGRRQARRASSLISAERSVVSGGMHTSVEPFDGECTSRGFLL